MKKMKENEFMEKIKKIEKFYEKELNEIQYEAWMNSLINMNIAQFDYMTKEIFTEFTYMPKLSQVIELKNRILIDFNKKENTEIQKEKCTKCRSTGIIRYFRTIDGNQYTYFARCTCKNGLKYIKSPFYLITDVMEREKNQGQKIKKVENKVTEPNKDIGQYLNQIGINLNEK